MTQKFDDITLSSYVDGELDPESMQEVEAFLESDTEARKSVVNAIRTTARRNSESMNIFIPDLKDSRGRMLAP